MPELPEVETIVQQLRKKVLNKKIVSVEILKDKMVDSQIKTLVPTKIINVLRRAKSIIIELERNGFLLIHLRMTGHFHYYQKDELDKSKEFEKHVVAKFHLNDGSLLTHNSVRMFGSIKLLNEEKLRQELAKLGPEPLAKDFTADHFRRLLEKKKQANIKVVLLDQKFIAGIGNIYAQEILYDAHVDPRRKISSLSPAEIKKIHESLQKILSLAVKNHGTTVESYVHIEGSGGYQKYLAVYHKTKCPKGHVLKSLMLGGRSTYYCPICQR